MITYQNMTPSQTFEERIVSVVNTGIDATATKVVCVTNGDLLRYKTLLPQVTTRVYTGTFNTASNELITLSLPAGLFFEFILNIAFKAYYNTASNLNWNNGITWTEDHDNTILFGGSGGGNPSTLSTFKMNRKGVRLASAPYKVIIMYFVS